MRRKNGYILVLTLMILAVILLFAFSYMNFYRSEKVLAANAEFNLIAASAADAGVEDALYHLIKDNDWTGNFDTSGTETVQLSKANSTYTVTFDSNNKYYSTNNINGSSEVTGYNNKAVPVGMALIVSAGKYPADAKDRAVLKVEQALVAVKDTQFAFDNAIHTEDTITIGGNTDIDSYNSDDGVYPNGAGDQGSIATNSNSTDPEAVDINGNPSLSGNITVGPGGSSDSVDRPPAGVEIVVAEEEMDMPSVSMPAGVASSGDLNSARTLNAGTYVFDSIDLNKENVAINAPGEDDVVNIYINGPIKLSGQASINADGQPPKLRIFCGPDTTIHVTSNGNMIYGVIYAPDTDIGSPGIAGGLDIFGSIASNTLDINGGVDIHYDEALSGEFITFEGNSVLIVSRWRW